MFVTVTTLCLVTGSETRVGIFISRFYRMLGAHVSFRDLSRNVEVPRAGSFVSSKCVDESYRPWCDIALYLNRKTFIEASNQIVE